MEYILKSGMNSLELIEIIKSYNNEESSKEYLSEGNELILKHGTSASSLQDILLNGLVGRKKNNRNNFPQAESNENLIYLTNKWHYMYAFISVRVSFENYLNNLNIPIPEDFNIYSEKLQDYWEETCDVPIVLTVRVNESDLLIDEDIVYNRKFKKELSLKKEINLKDLTYEKSLNQYTVACRKEIKSNDILGIEVVAYSDMMDIIFHNDYGLNYSSWCDGFIPEFDSSDVLEYMSDWNLGAIDELDINKVSNFNIEYSKNDCCVNISY